MTARLAQNNGRYLLNFTCSAKTYSRPFATSAEIGARRYTSSSKAAADVRLRLFLTRIKATVPCENKHCERSSSMKNDRHTGWSISRVSKRYGVIDAR
ncbi:hypothetical protein TSAR_002141 [Trichomalopsis sarcophagae]|uniref:Uncharacterized protein n=1 Tax=Trichomalopsis sarcophagae TaxID=543379 RepID=A0A232EKD4_9HYME|nr:hypothetical protein TSAR_002141 [Trichomalopsis sarcophagae]